MEGLKRLLLLGLTICVLVRFVHSTGSSDELEEGEFIPDELEEGEFIPGELEEGELNLDESADDDEEREAELVKLIEDVVSGDDEDEEFERRTENMLIEERLALKKAKGTPLRMKGDRWTFEEENYIVRKLEKSVLKGTYDYDITWPEIVKGLRNRNHAGIEGFKKPYDRSLVGVLRRFYRVMMKNKSKNAVQIPDRVKDAVNDPYRKFTKKEIKFIIKEVIRTNKPLNTNEPFEDMAREHAKMRENDPRGFPVPRNAKSLRSHLYYLRKGKKIPQEARRKHPDFFTFETGSSSKRSSKGKRKVAYISDE